MSRDRSTKDRPFQVYLPDRLYHALRQEALRRRMTLSAVARERLDGAMAADMEASTR